MGLPLLTLLILASPAGAASHSRAAQMMFARSESISAVESSVVQRLRSSEGGTRAQVASADSLARSRSGAEGHDALTRRGADEEGARASLSPPRPPGIASAARWIDSLPVKVDVGSGGFTLTLRLSGP